MIKNCIKTLCLMGVLLSASSNTAIAGETKSWNLWRDMISGINKNPTGVWAFMKNDSLDHNPDNYVLLPEYHTPCLWGGVPQSNGGYCWENSSSTIKVGVDGKNTRLNKYLPVLHPDFYSFVIIRWKSPISGTVNISGQFSLLDDSGLTGVNWFFDKSKTTIAQGSLNNLLEGNVFSLQNVTVDLF